MTAKTPDQLLTSFETGDVPQQGDYQNIFESFINVVQTTEQSISSDLTVSNLNAQTVSAAIALISTNLTVTSANISTLNVTTLSGTTFTPANVSAQNIFAGTGDFTSVSCQTIVASAGTYRSVSAQTMVTSALTVNVLGRLADTSVRAVGTTQGGAKALIAELNRVVSGSAADNNGVILSSTVGREQVVFNDTNINVNVYPRSGGMINDITVNNPYVVSASLATSFYYLGSNIYLTK